jgi:hypothetical protein
MIKTIETKELNLIKQQSSRAFNVAQALKIRTSEDLDGAKETLGKIAKAQKVVKARKEAITKPLMAGLKQVRDLFRPIEQTLDEAEDLTKGKMLDYYAFLDKKEDKAEKKIEAKIDEGSMSAEKAGEKLQVFEDKKREIPTMRIAKVLIEDQDKIPDEYWMLNLVKLNADVKAGREVPGAKLVYEETIRK